MKKDEKLIENDNIDKYFYTLYIDANCDFEKIKLYANLSEIPVKKFLEVVSNYIKNNISRPEYARIFDKLLQLKTKESIISFLDETGYSLNYLETNILSYFIFYRPDIYFLKGKLKKELRDKLNIYYIYLKEKDKTKIPIIEKSSLNYIKYILNLFLTTNYTVERFCYNKDLSITLFKKYLTMIKQSDPGLYEQINLKMQLNAEFKQKTIILEVYKILAILEKEEANFTILDFLEETSCSMNEFLKVADEILDPLQSKKIRIIIGKFKDQKSHLKNNSIHLFLKEKFVFNIDGNLIEITDEDKQNVITYLQSKDIPICLATFKSACMRLYQTSLDTKKINK